MLSISMHMQNLAKFHQFILKILSGNKILISIKGHNSVKNLWKLKCNNPNLDLVNINAYAKFGQIPSIRSQDIERKRNLTKIMNHQIKGHNSVTIWWKLMHNNSNLDIVNINAYAKFGPIPPIRFKILSRNEVGMTDNLQTVNTPPYFVCGGYNKQL